MIEFGALPPEVNSARMHFGLGSETLVASAAAWTALAAELGSAGEAFQAVTMALATGPWTGPSAVTMAAAAAPYVTWVMAEAALCAQRGLAATNAAMAFETARAGHIHPTIIASNRAELSAAVASNFLGVNSGLIAALETQYGEFWAQDAAAMYGYAGAASAITGSIIPDLPAATTVNPAGVAAQAAEVGADAGQSAGQAASTVGGASSNLGGMSGSLGSAMSAASAPLQAATQGLSALSSPLGSMSGLTSMFGGMGAGGMLGSSGGGTGFTSAASLGGSAGGGSSVNASMGGARGLPITNFRKPTSLSVPASWAGSVEKGATKEVIYSAAVAEEEGGTSAVAAPRGAMMPPGMGGSSSASNGTSGNKKFQSRPKMVPTYTTVI